MNVRLWVQFSIKSERILLIPTNAINSNANEFLYYNLTEQNKVEIDLVL